jgi:hypothetical protein
MAVEPERLEKRVLEHLWELIREDGEHTVRSLERQLGRKRGWLTNRLRGSVHLTFSQLFSALDILGIDERDFFEGVLPPRRHRGVKKEPTLLKAKAHFWKNLETDKER